MRQCAVRGPATGGIAGAIDVGIAQGGVFKIGLNQGDGEPQWFDVVVPSPKLLVDANRDGTIGAGETSSQQAPYWYRVNDDDDNEDSIADGTDNRVNGLGTDDESAFFPVFLDLRQLLLAYPESSELTWKLLQADGALNFVYTNLTQETAFEFYPGPTGAGYGPAFDQPVSSATVLQITSAGVELSGDFLTRIRNQSQGVVLVEGRRQSAQPLILRIEKGGATVAECNLPLEQLEIRHRTTRMPSGNWATYSPQLREHARTVGTVDAVSPDRQVQLSLNDPQGRFSESDVKWTLDQPATQYNGKSVAISPSASAKSIALRIRNQPCGHVCIRVEQLHEITRVAATAIHAEAFILGPLPTTLRNQAYAWAWNNRAALGDGYHNGGTDAGKHSYFNALGIVNWAPWGDVVTVDIADANEYDGIVNNYPANETCMDLVNNRSGRGIALQIGNNMPAIQQEIMTQIQSGRMVILEGHLNASANAGDPLPDGTVPTGPIENPGGSAPLVLSGTPPIP